MISRGQERRKRHFAEVLGTFCLVFSGTGAIVINDVSELLYWGQRLA